MIKTNILLFGMLFLHHNDCHLHHHHYHPEIVLHHNFQSLPILEWGILGCPLQRPEEPKNGNCDGANDAADADYNEDDDDHDDVVDDNTHIPGGGIGKQCSEDEVGREGDEVGSLAQRLEAWE